YLSLKNKLISGSDDLKYDGPDREWLFQYAKRKLKAEHFDYFVFGHRHLPLEISLNPKSTYINIGDWITHYTYGVFDGLKLSLKHWKPTDD
ncbi:MAG: UDP-2,3-diacylglucosamine diphosphatase, partial [Bacteroidota bacterium]|nr:UDP-2,3-diacylglucosamine diphosphatase [Bacteroidota bacterium]